MDISLHNTSSGHRETFVPIREDDVRVYYCGPTVYDAIHIGNLRAFLTADILVRVLRSRYKKVTFVRNITDIDDKIMQRAHENRESIYSLTRRTTALFHQDIDSMGLIRPDVEPLATDHVPDMVKVVETLIHRGHAYVVSGPDGKTVYFDTSSYPEHGKLSGRETMVGQTHILGNQKRNTEDFVLFKPSLQHQVGWTTPWGLARPGWHTECVAMSQRYLGSHFDIHGGGQDLLFPHHENENAQASCLMDHDHNHHDQMANYWVHNSMLLIDGKKMSKSEGNFLTIKEVLDKVHPEVIKMFLMSANYRSPLNFTWSGLDLMRRHMDRFYTAIKDVDSSDAVMPESALAHLYNDMDTPALIAMMHDLSNKAFLGDRQASHDLYAIGRFVGLFTEKNWFQNTDLETDYIEEQIAIRKTLKDNREWEKADKIRDNLRARGIILEDTKDGTKWKTES